MKRDISILLQGTLTRKYKARKCTVLLEEFSTIYPVPALI